MVHALCLLFHLLSSCLLSLFLPSLSAAEVLVTLFCIFSPAACVGYPVWSNIPGGDRSKLPGKFCDIYFKCVYFFPLLLWWFLLLWFIRTQEHYVCDNVLTLCVSAWNSSEGLNNRPLGLQPEPPFEETHLCSEITFIFSKYGWSKWNQFMWCSSFFFYPVMFCLGLICHFGVIAAIFDDFYCLWGTLTIERNLCWFQLVVWVCRCVCEWASISSWH